MVDETQNTPGSQEIQQLGLPNVLLLEDDPGVSMLLGMVLKERAQLTTHTSAEAVITKKPEGDGYVVPKGVDIVITDQGLAGELTGLKVIEIMQEEYQRANQPQPNFIMITGDPEKWRSQAEARGANVFGKPFRPTEFLPRFQAIAAARPPKSPRIPQK